SEPGPRRTEAVRDDEPSARPTTSLTPVLPSSGRNGDDAARGDRCGGDGPRDCRAGGPARPRGPDAGRQTGVPGPWNGADPLVPRQARGEEPDPAGPDARGLRPNSHDVGLGRGVPQRGRRDRGGLRGPRSEETRLSELDAAAPKKTILASNTSALPITKMALVTKRPKQVVGMHFFNPPMLMPLIEVIRADTTSDATLGVAVDLSKSLGKTAVVVKKDVPGFITTRVLGPYFEEAARIHDEEGVPIETIDAAMRFRAGFPMGPFELADHAGIDVLHHLI